MYKLCIFAHKIINKTAPLYLLDLYELYSPTTTIFLRTGVGRDVFMLKSSNESLPQKCIFICLLETWNKLPLSLRILNPIAKFKKHLNKTYFFKKAFSV